jgi:chemotaxis signal transduction protein
LPAAPDGIIGVVNFGGEIVPVFNFWRRLGLEMPAIRADHKILIARSCQGLLAFVIDDVDEIIEASLERLTKVSEQSGDQPKSSAVVPIASGAGIMVIEDVESFLTRAEEAQLSLALAAGKT